MTVRESVIGNLSVDEIKKQVHKKNIVELRMWYEIFKKIHAEAKKDGDKRVKSDDNPVSIQIGIIEEEMKRRGLNSPDAPISQVIGLSSLKMKGKRGKNG